MKLKRRDLLKGSVALAAFSSLPKDAKAWNFHGKQQIGHGWVRYPLGDGGYMLGIDSPNTGLAGGAVIRTDVAGGYVWNGTQWQQLCTYNSLSGTSASLLSPAANGVPEVRVAPSNSNYLYMIYGDTDATNPNGGRGCYAVYASTNKGATWTKTPLKFTVYGFQYWIAYGYDIGNGTSSKYGHQRMVIDPLNPLVAYVGTSYGATITGTYAGNPATIFRTLDGGLHWTIVPSIPVATTIPGYCGFCIDPSSAPTTASDAWNIGVTVSSRILLCSQKQGIWQSTDGGASFSKVGADTTPSTTLAYTTTKAGSYIVLQVNCMEVGTVSSVTSSPSLTWLQRVTPQANTNESNVTSEWYAVAAVAQAYTITVNYTDGGKAYQVDSSSAVTATNCTLSGNTITVNGADGGLAIGMEVTGTGITSSSAQPIGTVPGSPYYQNGNGIYIVSGTTPNFVLNTKVIPETGITVTGKKRYANMVGAFAVSNTNGFDSGGPKTGQFNQSGTAQSITTTANSLVFSFALSTSSTPDSGYTFMSGFKFWSEISSSMKSAGTYTPGNGVSGNWFITDSLNDDGSGTIAVDGTPQFAMSGPSLQVAPSAVWTGQIDSTGTYWCCESSGYQMSLGGIWRYLSGVWERLDGAFPAPMSYGFPTINSRGNAICVDPRLGNAGKVTFIGPNGSFRGFQVSNGNASPITSTTLVGETGGGYTSTITAPIVFWLASSGTGQGSSVGDMVIDAIDGTYLLANGNGVFHLNSNISYNPSSFSMTGSNISQGIEEMLVQEVYTSVSQDGPTFGIQDVNIINGQYPLYPSTSNVWNPQDSSLWSMDYASDNDAFVVTCSIGATGPVLSGFNYAHGDATKWAKYASQPTLNGNYGGCIACNSVGTDGLSPTNATACMVYIVGSTSAVPYYTTNNGNTWTPCTFDNGVTFPRAMLPFYPVIGRIVAADRVTAGKYYCFVPAGNAQPGGFYVSTNYGANFYAAIPSPGTPFVPGTTGAVTSPAFSLQSVPGKAGHLFICPSTYSQGSELALYYSTDGGAVTWNAVIGVNPCTFVSMGKPAPGNGYTASLVISGTVTQTAAAIAAGYPAYSSKSGYFRGDCLGTQPSDGFGWTFFGDDTSMDPTEAVFRMDLPAAIFGDLYNYGRAYVPWAQSGIFMYK